MKRTVKKIIRTKGLPFEMLVYIFRDKRFKHHFRRFEFKSSDIVNSQVTYGGKKFTLYRASNSDVSLRIYLNEVKGFFATCERCGLSDGITTIGGCFCTSCRSQAGNCMLCKRNRIDCCC